MSEAEVFRKLEAAEAFRTWEVQAYRRAEPKADSTVEYVGFHMSEWPAFRRVAMAACRIRWRLVCRKLASARNRQHWGQSGLPAVES